MERIADQKLSYQILTAWYSPNGRDPHWFLMVYPVEARFRRRVKEMLETEGLRRVGDFLRRPHTETELLTSHHFRCVFNPEDPTLSCKHDKGYSP